MYNKRLEVLMEEDSLSTYWLTHLTHPHGSSHSMSFLLVWSSHSIFHTSCQRILREHFYCLKQTKLIFNWRLQSRWIRWIKDQDPKSDRCGSLIKMLILWKPDTPLVTDWPRDASIHGWPSAGDLCSTEVGVRAHITAPVSTPGLATAPSLDSRGREAQFFQCLADQLKFVDS